MTHDAQPRQPKSVGPILRGLDAELAEAVIAAIERDNPDTNVSVDDQGGYVRIALPKRCVLTRATLEDEMGRSFPLSDLEPSLASFAGRIRTSESELEWYLERED